MVDDFIRLVIGEDGLRLLDSMTRIMTMQADITVVGSYACTEEAMECTGWQKVDVILVYLKSRLLKRLCPHFSRRRGRAG